MTREATPSIRGYNYQFHKTVLDLLRLDSPTASIQIEGIEDIESLDDTSHEAQQVKYLEAQKLIPSAISKPISFMILDFLRNRELKSPIKYRIYAHFGISGNVDFLSTDKFFKDVLNDLISDGKIVSQSDDKIKLENFRARFTLEEGPKLESLMAQVKETLGKKLSATTDEVNLYSYPQAIEYIFNIACNQDSNQRIITQQQFLIAINKKKALFGLWQKLHLGEEKYISHIRKYIGGLQHSKRREYIIFIDHRTFGLSIKSLAELICNLMEILTPVGKLTSYKPVTFVTDLDDIERKELKSYILDEELMINDGYEEITFKPDLFSRLPVCNTRAPGHKYIEKISYELKIVGLRNLEAHKDHLFGTSGLVHLNFSTRTFSFLTEIAEIISISQLSDVNQIKRIFLDQ